MEDVAPEVAATVLADDADTTSLFLRLPTEVRLIIYDLLLLKSTDELDILKTITSAKFLPATPDYYDYEEIGPGSVTPTSRFSHVLKIRTEDPQSYAQRQPEHRRSQFMIRSDRFRARCMHTTYHLVSNIGLHPLILCANQRIHAEAAEILYSRYTFDFDTHIEAIVPFFSDLTPFARSCVRSIRLVKRALPYEKEFDRAEWSNAINYIAENVPVQQLSLGIIAGKPSATGWTNVLPYNEMDFHFLKDMDGMEWVQDLLNINGLERLDVKAVVEHCPPPMSTAMARYVKFSSSVDGSFTQFLKSEMVA
ncbi:hypothetical protein MBLNU457_6013t1 [Dothideomycetes sp. NU457]